VEECIQSTELENLDFIPAGPIPPNPSELILSGVFAELIKKLEQLYDVIIIDTPPVGLVTDGIHALKIATIPIYIFRADFSRKAFLKNVNRLAKVNKLNNLSLILNSTKNRNAENYGYDKGYYEGTKSSKKRYLKGIFHFLS
jgi:capsular exopolysaccharide synthesis family protein